MELDKRISGKRPLDCVDSETAKEFIGKKGYFANCIQAFQDLESTDYQLVYATLKEVDSQRIIAFTDDFDGESCYFLPKEWVKEPEKKLRPYTGIEFAEKFGIWVGHVIRIRDRPENAGQEYEYKIMFVGYRWYKGMFEVFINGCWIDLITLFELYEYMEDGEWHKFGVEE